MEIDVLYFEDCPSYLTVITNLEAAARLEGIHLVLNRIEIKSLPEARQQKFLGSPSFRFNYQDLWPEERQDYPLSCRVYQTPQGLKGWPTIEMLRQKIRMGERERRRNAGEEV